MGLDNRDYMDMEPRTGFLSRVRSVTGWVIIANVAVFVLWQLARQNEGFLEFMGNHFTVSADGVFDHGRIHTLITSEISQVQPLHILFNMLFLYFFGRELETLYGKKNYLAFLAAAATVSSLAHVFLSSGPALGASGAVMAVVVVYAFFFPNRQIYFAGLFPMTVKWLAIIYVGLDLLGVFQQGSGIAHFAHLGGALTGLLWYKLDVRPFSDDGAGTGTVSRIGAWFRTRRERRPAAEREPERLVDPATEARVDALLEKIARDGLNSLTDDERKFLKKASTRYRA